MSKQGPLLTTRQYEWLEKLDSVDLDDAAERTLRSRLRDRIRHVIAGFELVFDKLPEEDREQLFEPKKSGDESGHPEQFANMMRGAPALIALLYDCTLKTEYAEFEPMLENAMHRVANRRRWEVEQVEFSVDFTTDVDFETRHERFEAGTATVGEAVSLLKQGWIDSDELAEYVESQQEE